MSNFLVPLPSELTNFPHIPENDKYKDILEKIKQASYPWEQIDQLWVLHQDIHNMHYDLDLLVQNIHYGHSPPLYVVNLFICRTNDEKKALLSRSVCCSSLNLSRQIVSSQALLLLTPQHAKATFASSSPNKVVFMSPIDTRDNIFELNGHTFMEQAMEVLSAAERTNPTEDVQRYEDREACWMDYNCNRRLTDAFRALLQCKREGDDDPEFSVYQWCLYSTGKPEGSENGADDVEPSERCHDFSFAIYRKGSTTPLVSVPSAVDGEPLTRLIYRGLQLAARQMKCETLMNSLWKEFALCVGPPSFNSTQEYLTFYVEAFFGSHTTHSEDSYTVLRPLLEAKATGWRCQLQLAQQRCGGFGAPSDVECLDPVLVSADHIRKSKAASTALLLVSTECFSFLLVELADHLKQLDAHPKEKHADVLRKALEYLRKSSALEMDLMTWRLGSLAPVPPEFFQEEPAAPSLTSGSDGAAEFSSRTVRKLLKRDVLRQRGSGLSDTSRGVVRLLEHLFSEDYVVSYWCEALSADKEYVSEISLLRCFEGEERKEEVFVVEGYGTSVDESFQRALSRMLLLLSSYRRMLSDVVFLLPLEGSEEEDPEVCAAAVSAPLPTVSAGVSRSEALRDLDLEQDLGVFGTEMSREEDLDNLMFGFTEEE